MELSLPSLRILYNYYTYTANNMQDLIWVRENSSSERQEHLSSNQGRFKVSAPKIDTFVPEKFFERI